MIWAVLATVALASLALAWRFGFVRGPVRGIPRWIAWQDLRGLRLLDTATGNVKSHPIPEGVPDVSWPSLAATDSLVVALWHCEPPVYQIVSDTMDTGLVEIAHEAIKPGCGLMPICSGTTAYAVVFHADQSVCRYLRLTPSLEEEREMAFCEDGHTTHVAFDWVGKSVTVRSEVDHFVAKKRIASALGPTSGSLAWVQGSLLGKVACAAAGRRPRTWWRPMPDMPCFVATTATPWTCIVGALAPFSYGYRVYAVDFRWGWSKLLYSGSAHMFAIYGTDDAALRLWEAVTQGRLKPPKMHKARKA